MTNPNRPDKHDPRLRNRGRGLPLLFCGSEVEQYEVVAGKNSGNAYHATRHALRGELDYTV